MKYDIEIVWKIINRTCQICIEENTNKDDAFAIAASQIKHNREEYLMAQERYLHQ